jgi:hypothetical protein
MELHDICNPIGFNNVGKFGIRIVWMQHRKNKEMRRER